MKKKIARQSAKQPSSAEQQLNRREQIEQLTALRRHVSNEIFDLQLARLQKPDLFLPPSWQPVFLEQAGVFYKVVAAVSGKLVSVFDGLTEYRLGRWTLSSRGAGGHVPLDACFYAYATPHQAVTANFPPNSQHLDAPKVLLQLQAKGRAYRKEDMWAFCKVKPTVLVSDITEGKTYIISDRYLGLPGL